MSKASDAKLIVFGTIKMKDGSELPVHFIHEIEDEKGMVASGKRLIDIVELKSHWQNWRKSPVVVTER